jgi:hypothetical protein
VPLNWTAVGNPAQILPPDKHDEVWAIRSHSISRGMSLGLTARRKVSRSCPT